MRSFVLAVALVLCATNSAFAVDLYLHNYSSGTVTPTIRFASEMTGVSMTVALNPIQSFGTSVENFRFTGVPAGDYGATIVSSGPIVGTVVNDAKGKVENAHALQGDPGTSLALPGVNYLNSEGGSTNCRIMNTGVVTATAVCSLYYKTGGGGSLTPWAKSIPPGASADFNLADYPGGMSSGFEGSALFTATAPIIGVGMREFAGGGKAAYTSTSGAEEQVGGPVAHKNDESVSTTTTQFNTSTSYGTTTAMQYHSPPNYAVLVTQTSPLSPYPFKASNFYKAEDASSLETGWYSVDLVNKAQNPLSQSGAIVSTNSGGSQAMGYTAFDLANDPAARVCFPGVAWNADGQTSRLYFRNEGGGSDSFKVEAFDQQGNKLSYQPNYTLDARSAKKVDLPAVFSQTASFEGSVVVLAASEGQLIGVVEREESTGETSAFRGSPCEQVQARFDLPLDAGYTLYTPLTIENTVMINSALLPLLLKEGATE